MGSVMYGQSDVKEGGSAPYRLLRPDVDASFHNAVHCSYRIHELPIYRVKWKNMGMLAKVGDGSILICVPPSHTDSDDTILLL